MPEILYFGIMRQLALLFLLISMNFSSVAQDSVCIWNKWCAKKDSMLLFSSGNNMIQVYSPTIKPADLRIKSLDKSLRIGKPEIKGDTLVVLAMPFPDKGKSFRIAVMNKNSKVIRTVSFACDTVPTPVATLGNLKGSEAKRKDILSQMTLRVSFPGSQYNYPYTINHYTFKISTPKGGATIPVKGFFINNDILKEISAAPEGTVILFTDIKATCPECATRTLNEIKMKIK